MKLTDEQKKFVDLTLALDKKKEEFKVLSEAFDKILKSDNNPNSQALKELKPKFEKNLKDISLIVDELKKFNK